MRSAGSSLVDRLARWTAFRRHPAWQPVAPGADPTRRDIVATASLAAVALAVPRLLRASAAEAMPMNCSSACNTQARAALAIANAQCDRSAKRVTERYEFFVEPALVEQHFRVVCYATAEARILAQLAKCKLGCLTGKTSARIASPTRPPVAPPQPPPPPNCPEGTFFCTVGAGGGDICCANGYTCCSCGVCCVPAVKCACCG
jgi:hypothetical protein